MKHSILLIAFAAMGLTPSVSAQQKIPEAVKSAFHQTYPNVLNPKWESENGNFEGNWKEGGYDHSALFSPQGKWVGSETDIDPVKLPAKAREYLGRKIPHKIKEASFNKDAKGEITYEADVSGQTYVFDKSGEFIKMVKEE